MKKHGFKSLPAGLKVLFVLLIVWILRSISRIPPLLTMETPIFGFVTFGFFASRSINS